MTTWTGSGTEASLQGTAAIAAVATAVHVFWSLNTLFVWTFFECPYWGLATASAALYGNEMLLAMLLRIRAGSPPGFFHVAADVYAFFGWWLAALASWRALWLDESAPRDRARPKWFGPASKTDAAAVARANKGRLERHFYSLVTAFGLWSASGAALGREWPAALGGGMVAITIVRVLVGSLFGEPLVLAGVLGLACGAGLLALVLRFGEA